MTTALLVVCLDLAAKAAMSAPAAPTTTVAPTGALALSTYTVATLYTGDRFRDPFVAASVGGRRKPPTPSAAPLTADIHELQLRGIMKDAISEFALFTADDGSTFLLRGGRLYGAGNKRVPGITGRLRFKQKRAELVTADKDVQIYHLGEISEEERGKPGHP